MTIDCTGVTDTMKSLMIDVQRVISLSCVLREIFSQNATKNFAWYLDVTWLSWETGKVLNPLVFV